MSNYNNKESGFAVVAGLLIVLVVAVIGFVGYYIGHTQKVANSKSSAKTTLNTADNAKDKASTTTQKPDPKSGYLVAKEWGLRFKIPSGLTDVKYIISGDELGFYAKPTGSNVQYRTDYAKVESDSSGSTYLRYAIGTLYRSTDSTKDYGRGPIYGKKLGDYYYYTAWSFSGTASGAACQGLYGDSDGDALCVAEGKAFDLVNRGDAALLNTIELAQ